MANNNPNITSLNKNFTKWYDDVLAQADLIHYGLVKGTIILTPNGHSLWENIKTKLNEVLMNQGVQNVLFPTLIPYSSFALEKKHLEGFAPEMFLVTKTAANGPEINDPLVLRPTSEIPFCSYFKDTLVTYNQLPIKLNQWANVFRVEKNTRAFLRNSEFYWQEMHSLHETANDALTYIKTINDEYKNFIENYLMIPVLNGEKTENERFAGADNTFTCEALMQDGQALQCATAHFLNQNFTKPYGITFRNKNNELVIPYQTSAGISTRIIGAIIMSHSDDNGLVLPWNIAIKQINVCLFKNTDEINQYAKEIKNTFKQFKVSIDNSDASMGKKLTNSFAIGTPLTIIIGLNEVQQRTVTLLWRNKNNKTTIALNDLQASINKLAKTYDLELFNEAKKRLDANIVVCHTLQEVKDAILNKKIALAPWGGNAEDEVKFRKETTFSPRCIKSQIQEEDLTCFYTSKKATHWVYFAKAY